MAVIKCANCENEILDSEVVCPYCDCPVNSMEPPKGSGDMDDQSTMKIASREDFEKEKAALMAKLEEEERSLNDVPDAEANEQTVKISKDDFNAVISENTDRLPGKELDPRIRSKAANIKITTPERSGNRQHRSSASAKKKQSKDKSKKLIVVITLIGVAIILYLIVALISNISDNMSSLKDKENKKAKVATSASENVDLGYKFTSSSTLVITSDDVMKDFEMAGLAPWADKADKIKHITIEDDVESIGDYAFSNFTVLEDVILGKNVSEIGKEAFYGCKELQRVTCRSESELRTIGDNAFTNCSKLENIKLGTSVRSIGDGAFKSCESLKEIELPQNARIGDDAFLGCGDELTIKCYKDSTAHEYADKNGINVEFIDDDSEEGTMDLFGDGTESGEDEDTEKEDKDTKENKDDKKDKDKNKDKSNESGNDNNSTGNTSNNEDSASESNNNNQSTTDNGQSTENTNSGKSDEQLLNEIMESNQKINSGNLSEDEKAKEIEKRDALTQEFNN